MLCAAHGAFAPNACFRRADGKGSNQLFGERTKSG
jgi:hypothetical protein